MIIKSLSRKKPSFFQLYDYMVEGVETGGKEDKQYIITKNLHQTNNRTQILKQFTQNYALLPSRLNGNSMYHEIISLPHQQNIPIKEQKEILYNLANKYLEQRVELNLCFGVIHTEKDHLHCHIMISSNGKDSDKRQRLNKAEFSNIQKEMELYKNQKFPELTQELIYTKEREIEQTYQSSTSRDREYQQKHRTKEPSRNDIIKQRTAEIMSLSYSKKQLMNKLKEHSIELYQRGQTVGIIDIEAQKKGKSKYKYRLKTLGLETEYENLMEFDRTREIERKKEELEQTREREQELEMEMD